MDTTPNGDTVEDHDRGLSHDLPTLIGRRRALGLLGGGLVAALAGCTSTTGTGSGSGSSTASTSTSATSATTGAATGTTGSSSTTVTEVDAVSGADAATGNGGTEIPEETGGPYPADGSNGVNVLTESGIVRRDIRSSFGTSTTRAQGVPLTFTLTVVDVSSSSKAGRPVRGAAVYAWHADREGRYSMYDQEISDENYLRGVQRTDRSGRVTFTSIFPACYDGRWPHIHFEVYPSLADATSASNKLRTSQLALPKSVCEQVYGTTGYKQSVQNLARVSLDSDMVFSDGYALQLATVTGSVSAGYHARLRVPV